MSSNQKWSFLVTVVGLVLLFVLSQIDETLGAWVGWPVVVAGAFVVPVVGWLLPRRSGPSTAAGRGDDEQERD